MQEPEFCVLLCCFVMFYAVLFWNVDIAPPSILHLAFPYAVEIVALSPFILARFTTPNITSLSSSP